MEYSVIFPYGTVSTLIRLVPFRFLQSRDDVEVPEVSRDQTKYHESQECLSREKLKDMIEKKVTNSYMRWNDEIAEKAQH
ncbi:hypothetical protein OSTOST_20577 [Ostertagia ostertagi]